MHDVNRLLNKNSARIAVTAMLLAAAITVGCGREKPTGTTGTGGSGGGGGTTGQLTYWQDVAPIYYEKCVRCHQEGGIGPFRLDNYADVKKNAYLELAAIEEGIMPPYFMVHDGSCGSFEDEATLSAEQKETIKKWVQGDQAEGTKTTVTVPPRPTLADALTIKTPEFAPLPQGGELAKYDEYRCFLLDAPNTTDAFLTGYDITPGDASIVHHALVFVVDPTKAGKNGKLNGEILKAVDDASPDRLGWPCFGVPDENVNLNGVPVTWAPGQGVVKYPAGMGVPITTKDKLVVQMHYNLADVTNPTTAGKTDSTTVHLAFAPTVSRQLRFLLPDPLLDSLKKPTPDVLPPGQKSTTYTWMATGEQLGIRGVPSVDLVAVFPHMHGRGVSQKMEIGPALDNMACASNLQNWDFHWQEFYFYKTMPAITPTTQVKVTCEYDTSKDTTPVLPGWGTRNEMCLNVLMIALPPAQ